MKTGDKVCIGLVTNGSINDSLTLDLLRIRAEKDSKFQDFLTVANIGATTKSRNLVVLHFLEQMTSDWLLMIDSDERLSSEAWHKLINAAHDKDRPVISALVFAKFGDDDAIRPVPTIYRSVEGADLRAMDDYPLDSLIPVTAVGTGCLLIHRDVLLKLQESAAEHQGPKWAWFAEGAINGTYFGEDILFCKRINALGYQIYAHTGAILPHQKTFWLDERHHRPMREATLKAVADEKAQLDAIPTL